MERVLNKENLRAVSYRVGNEEILSYMPNVPPLPPFDSGVMEFLNQWSRKLLEDKAARPFPDVVTFAFWIRKGNLAQLMETYHRPMEDCFSIGRGMVFHIAPSNVPVNFAYSLVAGLLSGNANVVKVPSKQFEQVDIIARALNACLAENEALCPYIVLVQYGHEREVNDALSEYADARVIWGGDQTVAELRKSPLPARGVEVTFADRYSLAVIDSDAYLALENRKKVANDFYNDTYLTDQNACTSPRAVIWTGSRIPEAQEAFWAALHELAQQKYAIQPVQVVNKITSAYLLAAKRDGVSRVAAADNLITRVAVDRLDDGLMELKDNSGYFFEYCCRDIRELRDICDNTHCQTVSYIGDKEMLRGLLDLHLKGVDRIVPVGQTMDFELIWDGYRLLDQLSRTVRVR